MIVEKEGFVQVTIRVVARAARSEIVGEHDGMLKLRIASPPVDGAANAEVVKLLAKKLGVPKSAVAIVSGETSKTKQIRITGVTHAAARKLLGV